jgi:serine protease AprX
MDQSSVGSTIHIGDLSGTSVNKRSNTWKAKVTIEIHDDNCNIVDGAKVSGTWSGGYTGSSSCITQNGRCLVKSRWISNDNEQTKFTIENIVAPDLTYKSEDNHGLDGDSDGTSITVDRP